MLEDLEQLLSRVFGLGVDPKELELLPLLARTFFMYFAGLLIVRAGKSRFLGKSTPLDIILAFIIGSTLGRAINGSAPLFETVGAGFLLVSIHWLIGKISVFSHRFGNFIKGEPEVLINDGQVNWDQMRRSNITREDLLEGLHLQKLPDTAQVKLARLERSGNISAIPKIQEPRVIDIKVESGVQTVRLVLGP